jgi:hypothetical protein
LWDILVRLGYQVDGLYLGLGIDGGINYSHESQRLTEEFAQRNNLKLHVVDIERNTASPYPCWRKAATADTGSPAPCAGSPNATK